MLPSSTPSPPQFFVKATLLERVSNKLTDISETVKQAGVSLGGAEAGLDPMRREREELMEEVQVREGVLGCRV